MKEGRRAGEFLKILFVIIGAAVIGLAATLIAGKAGKKL